MTIRSLLSFLFTLNVFFASAQNLKPICQVGSRWNYIYSEDLGNTKLASSLQTITCLKDTTIYGNRFSVLKADSGAGHFLEFSYLAKDDSNGLYFYSGSYIDTWQDSIFLAYVFQESDSLPQDIYITSVFSTSGYNDILTRKIKSITKKKVVTNYDSIEVYSAQLQYQYQYGQMHPKYLNLQYGSQHNHGPYFGLAEFAYGGYDWLTLSCFTDSTGTVKFRQEYFDKSCDYVGVSEIKEKKQNASIFPNPANDKFYLSTTPQFRLTSFEILNVTGETLLSQAIKETNANEGINIQSLPEGMYLCKIVGENEFLYQKLVVKH